MKYIFFSSLFLFYSFKIKSQTTVFDTITTYNIGKSKHIISLVKNEIRKKSSSFQIPLYINQNDSLIGKVNRFNYEGNELELFGNELNNESNFTFTITNDSKIEGRLILFKDKKAFIYSTNINEELLISEVDINSVVCIDYKINDEIEIHNEINESEIVESQPDLQSLPGCPYVLYIDMDGEVSTSSWNGGNTITAAHSGFNLQQMKDIWLSVSEAFAPFNVNVTTNRSVFDAAQKKQRMMCICTPTRTVAPSINTGGIAYIGSFIAGNDDPCWSFGRTVSICAKTVSHEFGHTLLLKHHGNFYGEYYNGHANWVPIMGLAHNKEISHWCKGEYEFANNTKQPDLFVITFNGITVREDDHGNNYNTATVLNFDENGIVLGNQNKGIIEKDTDIDVFKFSTLSRGPVKLDIQPNEKYPNLNIKVRLYDSTEKLLLENSPASRFSASIDTIIEKGEYFLFIEGVGDGLNPIVGFSDYGSLGNYSISGKVSPLNPLPKANFISNKISGCHEMDVQFTDLSYNAKSWQWYFEGGMPSISEEQNPVVKYINSGSFKVSLIVKNEYGEDSIVKQNLINLSTPEVYSAFAHTICSSKDSIILSATANNDSIKWYRKNSNFVLQTGNVFKPNINNNTNYTVLSYSNPNKILVGNYIRGNFANYSKGFIIFDAHQPFILESFTTKNLEDKTVTLILKDENNNVLNSKDIFVRESLFPSYQTRVLVNMEIPKGKNLQIGFDVNPKFEVFTGNIKYPFTVDNVLTIKSSSSINTPYDLYFFMEGWIINSVPSCTSKLQTVEVKFSDMQSPFARNLEVCQGSENIITQNNPNNVQTFWLNNDSIIHIGNDLSLIADTTSLIDVKNYTIIENKYKVGKKLQLNGEFSSANNNTFLVFDTSKDIFLKSALIKAKSNQERTLILKDSIGNIINSKKILTSIGETRIDINMLIPQGTNYQIGFLEETDLYYNDKGVIYPYAIKDLISIKSSSPINNESGLIYPFLFDWEVHENKECFSDTKSFYVFVNSVDNPMINNVSFCENETKIVLQTTNFNTVAWYKNKTDIVPIKISNFLETEVNSDTSFYLSSLSYSMIKRVGDKDLNIINGEFSNNAQYLKFNAYKNFILKSVWINCLQSQNVTIELFDEKNQLIYSSPLYLYSGTQKISLNIPITIGDNYKIGLSNNANCFVKTKFVTFPYSIQNIISITGNSNLNNSYPYLFDWEITDVECESERIEVSAYKDICTNIQYNHQDKVLISPNPFSDNITVSGLIKNSVIKIFDINGKLILECNNFEGTKTLNLSNLNPGVYFLNSSHNNQNFKIIKN